MTRPSATARPVFVLLASLAVLVAAVAGCAGCGSDKNKGGEPSDCTRITGTTFTLTARNLLWSPDCLEVKAGTTVAFTVKLDDVGIQHNFVMTGGPKGGTKLQAGPATQHLTVSFPEAGTYGFKCDIHPNMTGQIYVVS